MDFSQATEYYRQLRRQLESGDLDQNAFKRALASIQFRDDSGYTWTVGPDGQWLYWNGSAWTPSGRQVDKQERTPASGGEPPAGEGLAAADDVLRRSLRWIPMLIGALRGRLPPPATFLQQSRNIPLKDRPQPWWDAVAIMGGAAGGFLWFLYSSVRGMPHLSFLHLDWESYFDFLPPLFMAAAAALLFLFRSRIAVFLRPILSPLRRIPLIGRFGIGGVFLAAGLLIRYKSSLFETREGLDLITPLLMLLLPILFVVFRKPIDAMLLPLDPLRRKIPRIVLIGMGLAVPYLVAHILYSWFNMAMYPFLRITVVLGTMVSYAILRTPERPVARSRHTDVPDTGATPPPLPPARPEAMTRRMAWVGLAWMIGIHLVMISPLFADDFLRDPFNGNDGLRTPGIATGIAGTVTVIVSGLVNGAEVVRTIIEARSEGGDGAGSAGEGAGAVSGGDQQEEPRQVQIRVDTFDATGIPSTRIEAGVENRNAVFIYADCIEVGKGQLAAETAGISFHLASGSPFVFLTDHGMLGGKRCAGIQLAEPLPQGVAPPEVMVSVSTGIAGDVVSVPVRLGLLVQLYRIRFR